jgi:hypothetical protein
MPAAAAEEGEVTYAIMRGEQKAYAAILQYRRREQTYLPAEIAAFWRQSACIVAGWR